MSGPAAVIFPSLGDRRAPNRVAPPGFRPQSSIADYSPIEIYSLASLILGMAALLIRNRIAAWLAFFAFLASLAHQKSEDRDFKQLAGSFSFALIGLIVNYLPGKENQEALIGL